MVMADSRRKTPAICVCNPQQSERGKKAFC
jgi:hypothetical protein